MCVSVLLVSLVFQTIADRDGLSNTRAVYKLRSLYLQSLYCYMKKIRLGIF